MLLAAYLINSLSNFTIGDPLAAHETIPRRIPVKLDNNRDPRERYKQIFSVIAQRACRYSTCLAHRISTNISAAVLAFLFPPAHLNELPCSLMCSHPFSAYSRFLSALVKHATGDRNWINLEFYLEIETIINMYAYICTYICTCTYIDTDVMANCRGEENKKKRNRSYARRLPRVLGSTANPERFSKNLAI